uniref:C2H2-type domain-containing protein n=2 Tax=Macrostomum lignano TaxID=282301 RepID=A0A1I8H992_9PLAT
HFLVDLPAIYLVILVVAAFASMDSGGKGSTAEESGDALNLAVVSKPCSTDQPIDLSKPSRSSSGMNSAETQQQQQEQDSSVEAAGSHEVSSSAEPAKPTDSTDCKAKPPSTAAQESQSEKAEPPTASVAADKAPIVCKLCKVNCSSLHNYKMHLDGRQHRKAAAFAGIVVGENVRLTAESDSRSAALVSFGEAAPKAKKAPPDLSAATSSTSAGPSAFHCDVCNIDVTGAENLKAHYAGKKHRNAVAGLEKQKNDEQDRQSAELRCEICDLKFAGPCPYKDHMQGRKHAAKLRELDAIRDLEKQGCLPKSSLSSGKRSTTDDGDGTSTASVKKCKIDEID